MSAAVVGDHRDLAVALGDIGMSGDAIKRLVRAAGELDRLGGSFTTYDPNPLVSHVISLGVRPTGTAPSLFESGTLPPYLASGLDPMTLLHVPAAARHPLARAKTFRAVQRILAAYSDPDAVERAAQDFIDDDGNVRYSDRVRMWVGAVLPPELPLGVDAWAGAR